ncbi:hypothetical protein [Nocardia neocaledoniensis]|uniref:hypothetical protein n=1 Tax=Nocardia neocaledoniensis TaxID=236511 RepID=UPI00245610A6|nr:hypothetical protein [Nocardia neocaledoniensis]
MHNERASFHAAPTPDDALDTSLPFGRPIPALPVLANPDSSYTTMPGTNDQLVHHNALRTAIRPTLIWSVIMVPVYLAPFLIFPLPVAAIPVVVIAVVAWIALSYYLRLRKMFRSVIDNAAPAPTTSVRLGADAVDLADRTSHSRIAHNRITSLTTGRGVAILRYDGLRLVMPQELWPEAVAVRLRELIDPRRTATPGDPPPQPPLPRPPSPHVTVVAGPDTAHRLAVALRREPWRAPVSVASVIGLALIAVSAVILGADRYGALGAVFPAAICVLLGAGAWHLVHRPAGAIMRHELSSAYPGATISAQFGADAVLLATPAWILRVSYTVIEKLTLRSDVALLAYGQIPIALPGALFPPQIVEGLRERGVTVHER